MAIVRHAGDVGAAAPIRLGLLSGIVTFGPMLGWLVEPAGYLALFLLTLIQALWIGLFALVASRWVLSSWVVLVAPVVWTGIEAWRGIAILNGFDWGALGYAHAGGSWLLPMGRILGMRGLTLFTVLIGVLLFDAVRRGLVATHGLEGSAVDRFNATLPHSQPPLLGFVAALIVATLISVEPPATVGTLDVLAVQGNDQLRWTGGAAEEDAYIASTHAALTAAAIEEGGVPDLVVWPESSVDRDPYAARGADLLPAVTSTAALLGDRGTLVFGSNLDGPRERTFLNSVVVADVDGSVRDRYVKHHLVPFGEYVPWREVLGDFPPLRQVPFDGVPGPRGTTIAVDGVRMAVAICFETLFGDVVRDNVNADGGAGLILATTNDASFGETAEPAQHLAQSQLRAVETGRWVVHAAISGSSAFVSPAGEVLDATDLFTATTIRRDIPLAQGRTPFLVLGDAVGVLTRVAVVAYLLAALALSLVRRRQRDVDHAEIVS